MSQFLSPLAAAGALLSLPSLGAAPALALSPVTFVSGRGTDTGTCASPASPCRTFQFALGQTSAKGEIKALDPASYGGIIITKSISITGVEGASINRPSGDHITINAGPNDSINLSYLILDGDKTANNGIKLNSGGALTVSHCTVRNFQRDRFFYSPAGKTSFLVADTIVSGNSHVGINLGTDGTGSAQGTVDNVLASANGTGVFVNGTSMAESAGDNFIQGNDTDVAGTLTKVTTQ